MVYGGGSATSGQLRVGDRLLGIGEIDLLESFPSEEIGNEAYRLLASPPGTALTVRFVRGTSSLEECTVRCGGNEALWAYQVLKELDPDPWRTGLRTAIVQSDLKTLRAISRKAELLSDRRSDEEQRNGILLLANALVLLDRSNESIRFMESVQLRHPSNFWINQQLGTALVTSYQPHRPEASVRYLTAAVALRPNNAGSRWALSKSLSMLGNEEQAQEQEQIARQLTPPSGSFLNQPVCVSAFEASESAEIQDIDGTFSMTTLERSALELVRNGKRAEALQLIAEKESQVTDRSSLRRARAIVLAVGKDFIGAKVLFAQWVRANPQDAIAHWYYATVLRELGDPTRAIGQCEAALRASPTFDPAKQLLNELLVR